MLLRHFFCVSLIVSASAVSCTRYTLYEQFFFSPVSLLVYFSVASCTYLKEYQVLGVCFFSTQELVCHVYIYVFVLCFVLLFHHFVLFISPLDRRHVVIVLPLLEIQILWPSRPLWHVTLVLSSV